MLGFILKLVYFLFAYYFQGCV